MEFLDLETTKLLTEAGYKPNGDSFKNYGGYWIRDINDESKIWWINCLGAYRYVDKPKEYYERPVKSYYCITGNDALEWLRNKLSVFIIVYPEYHDNDGILTYRVRIMDYDNIVIDNNKGKLMNLWFERYEEAVECGIKYYLTNNKHKNNV